VNDRIVVTGGGGFIGRNVVEALNLRGTNDILLVDQLGREQKWMNLLGLAFDDLLGPQEFLDLLDRTGNPAKIGTIVHLGACSATTESDADYLLSNNYHYTRRTCEWSLAHDVRFVYASSAATYGDGSAGYSDDDAVTFRLRPLNMYGYSKHLFDLWALRSGALSRIAGLKYFNVYGPYEQHKGDMRSVVSKAYSEIMRTGKLSLFRSHRDGVADGEQSRDFISVADAVQVTLYFLDTWQANGLFNCGTGTARTWLDLARAVFSALDREPHVEFVDIPPQIREKYQYFTQADETKLRDAGYRLAFRSLETAVPAYVDWLRCNVE
jgi:ADP-L-glycero-D-manno-heptose 6-epimerase